MLGRWAWAVVIGAVMGVGFAMLFVYALESASHIRFRRVRIMQTQAAEAPRELRELASRIERLRERMKRGDPDMTADELQAAIEKAEEKRRELQEQQAGAALSGRAPSILPRAAELYRRQVALGLEGDPQATLKARVFLRDWFGGKIRLEPLPDGGLMAHWNQNVGALCKGLGSCGSGGVICILHSPDFIDIPLR